MRYLRWIYLFLGLLIVGVLIAVEEWQNDYALLKFLRDVVDWNYGRPYCLWLLLLVPLLILFSIRTTSGRLAAREWGKLLAAGKVQDAFARFFRDCSLMSIRQWLIVL